MRFYSKLCQVKCKGASFQQTRAEAVIQPGMPGVLLAPALSLWIHEDSCLKT